MDVLSVFTNASLSLFHLPANLDIPLISGMFEITLGSKLVSEADAALLAESHDCEFYSRVQRPFRTGPGSRHFIGNRYPL